MEALIKGAEKMHIEPQKAHGGVVGATGSIGRACALLLSERVQNIILFGNPEHVTSSKNRLASLTGDLFKLAIKRRNTGELSGLSLWVEQLVRDLNKKGDALSLQYAQTLNNSEEITGERIAEMCVHVGWRSPITCSLNISEDLQQCNMIIATSNSPEYLVYPDDLRSGAVVCDVARPADVAPECYTRKDVLILEGGLVKYPEPVSFGPNLGYRNGVNVACLTETVLLAMEGDYQDYSIGTKMPLETMEYMRGLAKKHGFELAGLKMGNKEITDEEIEEIYNNSLGSLQKAGNL